jgi:uncharacterized protein YndB with AHSA1/START domain
VKDSNDVPRPIVRVTRLLPARPKTVFAAWTDAEGFKEWFCPFTMHTVVAELDVRVGGYLRIVMRGGDEDFEIRGVYREVRPPTRLVFTWTSGDTRGKESVVTVDLRAVGTQTELTLTHELLQDEESRTSHQRGWESIVGKLGDALARRHAEM